MYLLPVLNPSYSQCLLAGYKTGIPHQKPEITCHNGSCARYPQGCSNDTNCWILSSLKLFKSCLVTLKIFSNSSNRSTALGDGPASAFPHQSPKNGISMNSPAASRLVSICIWHASELFRLSNVPRLDDLGIPKNGITPLPPASTFVSPSNPHRGRDSA